MNNQIKNGLMAAALLLALVGCSKSATGEKFIGDWTQVNNNGLAPIKASIAKQDNSFQIELSMPLPNREIVKVKKIGKLQDGNLVTAGIEKISIEEATGHMKIGANEFEKAK